MSVTQRRVSGKFIWRVIFWGSWKLKLRKVRDLVGYWPARKRLHFCLIIEVELQIRLNFQLVLQLHPRRDLPPFVGLLPPYRSLLLHPSASACFNMSQSEVLSGTHDAYNGIQIDPIDLPADPREFASHVAPGKARP